VVEEENLVKGQTRRLTLGGLLIALVAIGTMVIKVPTPATNGYIHIGDSMIYVVSILFGPQFGLIAAGFGSALADLLLGYSHWALPTLLIKGLEGVIIGSIAYKSYHKLELELTDFMRMLAGMLIGGLWMVGGYYVAGALLRGSWVVALDSVVGNITQAVGGMVIAIPIIIALLKTNLLERMNN
jgi:uncharacterized membrane protein